MYNAILDDGRVVIVDTSRNQERMVTTWKQDDVDKAKAIMSTRPYFLHPDYVNVWLDGNWQAVKRKRLKELPFGNPFEVLK